MTETNAESKIKFLADEYTFVKTVRLMRDFGCEVQRIQELEMNELLTPDRTEPLAQIGREASTKLLLHVRGLPGR